MTTSAENFKPGLIPCGHRVLVCPIETEEVTASGIVILESVKEREDMKQIEAIVVSVGPSAWADQAKSGQWAKPNDRVIIAKYSGLTHKGRDGKMYRIISDLDVVGVLKND